MFRGRRRVSSAAAPPRRPPRPVWPRRASRRPWRSHRPWRAAGVPRAAVGPTWPSSRCHGGTWH
eukprot:3226070-Prymnesium_polylepis.2